MTTTTITTMPCIPRPWVLIPELYGELLTHEYNGLTVVRPALELKISSDGI